MKFNTVIGNPPYNDDIYLDFIQLGHNISSEFVSVVVPAKWQAKDDGKNITFRNKLVPYIDKIVFYKDTKDAFDIGDSGGICYFIMDKTEHKHKLVKTICSRNKNFDSGTFEVHTEENLELLNNKIKNIVNKLRDSGENTLDRTLSFRRQVYVLESDNGESTSDNIPTDKVIELYQGNKLVGYKNYMDLLSTEGLDKYKCIQSCKPVQGSNSPFSPTDGTTLGSSLIVILKPYQIPKGTFQLLACFDTYEEAENFKSYIGTKLMSLMQFLGTCGITVNKTFFRYIPDPGNWHTKYADLSEDSNVCSLYKKYKLTDDEINTVESIIRLRKPNEEV